jgi:hypothetical protein
VLQSCKCNDTRLVGIDDTRLVGIRHFGSVST